jgi:hypothetical protein
MKSIDAETKQLPNDVKNEGVLAIAVLGLAAKG